MKVLDGNNKQYSKHFLIKIWNKNNENYIKN